MPVFYDGAFIRVKSQKVLTIFAKTLNHNASTNLLKGFSGNTLTWNIFLILIPYKSQKKNQFQNTFTYKNLVRLNIFVIYLPLKLIFFIVHIFSIRTFSLYQTKGDVHKYSACPKLNITICKQLLIA